MNFRTLWQKHPGGGGYLTWRHGRLLKKSTGNFSIGQRVCPPCLPSPTEAFDVQNSLSGRRQRAERAQVRDQQRHAKLVFTANGPQCEPVMFNADAAAGPVA